jgi:membrane protein DedA with SNARE-associated domain
MAHFGYSAVAILMAIESACIPLPSELIMPVAGWMTVTNPDRFTVFGAGVAGAVGCVIGSVASYYVGMWGGRPFAEKYGKWVLIRHSDLEAADRFFTKYGNSAIFISRLLPVVRTFISFPAGVSRMNILTFTIYTFIGSLPWCTGLAYAGKLVGGNFEKISGYFHGADVVIGVIIVAGLAYYIYHHVKPEHPKCKTKGGE